MSFSTGRFKGVCVCVYVTGSVCTVYDSITLLDKKNDTIDLQTINFMHDIISSTFSVAFN